MVALQYEEALEHARMAVELSEDPSASVFNNLGYVLSKLGLCDGA